jgi:hypothetical protein
VTDRCSDLLLRCVSYAKMNASLRLARFANLPKSNRYVNTIYLCASGMKKISGASRIPKGRKVYRGMAGVRLPGVFVDEGEDGSRGGVERGFMSTTTSKVTYT